MPTTTPCPEATASDLTSLLGAVDDLPSIPETLIRILTVLDDPQSSARALAEVIRLDAPLTSKILRLANSPYYSASGTLADVQACIGVLGFKTVRQVAICVSIASSLVPSCRRRPCRLDYRELWRHCVATAVIAKELARLRRTRDPEEIFTAGLLHDLGKFVAVIHDPEAYDGVVAHRAAAGRPLVEVERDVLGWDHQLAGEAFGEAWRFPALLTAAARRHHDAPAGDGSRAAEATALVALADRQAHLLEPPACDLGHDPALVDPDGLCAAAGLAPAAVEAAGPGFRAAIARARAYLELA